MSSQEKKGTGSLSRDLNKKAQMRGHKAILAMCAFSVVVWARYVFYNVSIFFEKLDSELS